VGLLAGAASFLLLVLFHVKTGSFGGEQLLLDWLLNRPLLAAAYVAAAVAVPVVVAARHQPPFRMAVRVGNGVVVAYPSAVAVLRADLVELAGRRQRVL
jgi:hypothetical protein